MSIHPATAVGPVFLTVAGLDRSVEFYRSVIGLGLAQRRGSTAVLSADGALPLVVLSERPGAHPQPRRTTGLYHLAILVPNRPALAAALNQLLESGYPLQGASDHLVSEALYLADPDGNGIEIYVDRPRDRWPSRGDRIAMATDPLDVDGLLAELGRGPRAGGEYRLPAGTRVGHIHLRVSELAQAEAFYHGLLGFDVMQRDYPGALFLAAGGYHHHIGVNTWAGVGAPPPPPTSAGLRQFAIVVPEASDLQALQERLRSAGIAAQEMPAGWFVRDPSQNGILLVAGPAPGITAVAEAVLPDEPARA